jgi:hypothetical protein
VDHRSFRDQLAFSIGFAVARSRDLLRRLLKEHVTDDAQQMLANRVVEHLELSGFEIDETDQVMRKRPADPQPRLGLGYFSIVAVSAEHPQPSVPIAIAAELEQPTGRRPHASGPPNWAVLEGSLTPNQANLSLFGCQLDVSITCGSVSRTVGRKTV